MRRPNQSFFSRFSAPGTPAAAVRPGRITALRGIIFQSDGTSWIGELCIRPIEAFDRWQAGLTAPSRGPSLAMHAGLHVALEDGREFVAEQLVGTWFEDFHDALNWTPLADFQARDHQAGWDLTVPATAFREIDDAAVQQAIDYLNVIEGRPFLGEDCTTFVERAFGGRRLFGDSPTARNLGVGLRVGDPALPLLRRDTRLGARAETLLRVSTVREQEDPLAGHGAPNARVWLGRIVIWMTLGALIGSICRLAFRRNGRRRSISSSVPN
jgi:hypothetical protein